MKIYPEKDKKETLSGGFTNIKRGRRMGPKRPDVRIFQEKLLICKCCI